MNFHHSKRFQTRPKHLSGKACMTLSFGTIALFFTLGWGPANAAPTTPADWFCTRSDQVGNKLFPPVITQIPDRSCSGGKEPLHSICSMSAHCIFLTPQIRHELSAAKTTSERERFLVRKYGKDKKNWINAAISCNPNSAPSISGSPTCPPPELCKNSPGIRAQEADLMTPQDPKNPTQSTEKSPQKGE